MQEINCLYAYCKGKCLKLYCIISMEKGCIVQRISILGSYRPSTPRNHDSTPRVPSEGTLLNVYTIKDKP